MTTEPAKRRSYRIKIDQVIRMIDPVSQNVITVRLKEVRRTSMTPGSAVLLVEATQDLSLHKVAIGGL